MSKKLEVMEVVKEVFENGFINDHFEGEDTCEFIGILTQPYKNRIYAVPLRERCCINPFYYCQDDGRVHLSTWSVAGTINAWDTNHDMDLAVERFNRERLFRESVEHYAPFEYMVLIRKSDWMARQKRIEEV